MKNYHLKYWRNIDVKDNVITKGDKETEFMETVVAEDLQLALEYWHRTLIDPDNKVIGIYVGEPVVTILKREPQPSPELKR